MIFNAETRRRNAFIEAAIASTQTELTTNPHLSLPESIGNTMLSAFVRVGERLFIPNIRDGEVVIPRRHKDGDGIPVLARREGDPQLNWSAGFAQLYPRQQRSIARTMEGWGFNGKDISASRYVTHMQDVATKLLAESSAAKDAIIENRFKDELDAGPMAVVLSPRTGFTFLAGDFKRMGAPAKVLYLRPFLSLGYRGPETEPITPPTMVHEYTHILQFERDTLITDNLGTPAADKQHMRHELEANYFGAGVSWAMQQNGAEITGIDRQQLKVDDLRAETNKGRPKDPFSPNGTLRNILVECGLDF